MSISSLNFTTYDCFTDSIFGGNIGVIVWNSNNLNNDSMQKIAKEFNAPVTSFIIKKNDNEFTAKFFMPSSEISMCGHLVIGIFSHVSKNQNIKFKEYILNTNSETVKIIVEKEFNSLSTVMYNSKIAEEEILDIDEDFLLNALNINKKNISQSSKISVFNSGLKHALIRLEKHDILKNLSPDYKNLYTFCEKYNLDTVACFTQSSKNLKNFFTRDFCPLLGKNEVAASGTTNAAITSYLFKNQIIKHSSQRIIFNQGDEIGRSSKIISDIIIKNGELINLKIGGSAVLNYFGNINI